jgi:prepilin-type processing-associated H-X9-DG protein
LALHQFHGDYEVLPPGLSGRRGRFGEQPNIGWHARLLPYVEQGPLWAQTLEAYRQTNVPYTNPPHVGFATVVRLFVCTDDPDSQEAHDETVYRKYRAAFTDYLGVLGLDYKQKGGVLYRNSAVRLTDVLDGTSNTLAAGERPPTPDFVLGWWYAGGGQDGGGSGDMVLGVRELNARPRLYSPPCPLGPNHFSPGDGTHTCHFHHFWSYHPGGAHFLFCDGSVRFLTYDADPSCPPLPPVPAANPRHLRTDPAAPLGSANSPSQSPPPAVH